MLILVTLPDGVTLRGIREMRGGIIKKMGKRKDYMGGGLFEKRKKKGRKIKKSSKRLN
jgi:hypothetical protein